MTSSLALPAAIAGLFGLLFGSFGNVVIWRFPRGESLSHPGSHCPRCNKPIAWYDNVPIVSWLLLRGRCRACGAPISARYPLVELLSGVLWAVPVLAWGVSAQAGFAVVFFYLLLLLTFIDIDTQRLPNALVAIAGLAGLAGVLWAQFSGEPAVPLIGAGPFGSPILAALIGAVVSAGAALLISGAYWLIRHAEGVGMGDIKLLAVIGLFLGAYGLMAFLIANLLGAVGSVISLPGSGSGMRTRIPFGPYLAAATIITALAGEPLLGWYLGLVGM